MIDEDLFCSFTARMISMPRLRGPVAIFEDSLFEE
jgi:hypothetical protein